MARKWKMDKETVEYLNGLLSDLDDLPDGAWEAICKDKIEADPRFCGADPYEVWLAWMRTTYEETKGV